MFLPTFPRLFDPIIPLALKRVKGDANYFRSYIAGGGKVMDVDPAATSVNPVWRTSATHHFELLVSWGTDTPFSERNVLRQNATALVQRLNPVAPVVAAYHNECVTNWLLLNLILTIPISAHSSVYLIMMWI